MTNGERTQVNDTTQAKTTTGGGTDIVRQMMAAWDAERKEQAVDGRRHMFDLLSRGGYDRVEVKYDGYGDSGQVKRMTFYRGDAKVRANRVPKEVRTAVESYLYAALPDGWEIDAGSCGTARIYPASQYAAFNHTERDEDDGEDWTQFSDGEPGPDVPDDDR